MLTFGVLSKIQNVLHPIFLLLVVYILQKNLSSTFSSLEDKLKKVHIIFYVCDHKKNANVYLELLY